MSETAGELNIGKHYFEGDIKLTTMQRDYLNDHTATKRALISDVTKLWPHGTLPYVVDDGLSDISKGYIKSAMKEWEKNTCVRFSERKNQIDHLKFVYEGGCSSYVGRIGGEQTISIGSTDGSTVCRHGNIVHEIAHSLGYFHEHSRPDRDEYVKVLWDNIRPEFKKNFNKEDGDTINSRGVKYDYSSVMHYGAFFFTSSAGSKTLETKEAADIGQRIGLSALDIDQANLLYSCKKSDSKAATNSRTGIQPVVTVLRKSDVHSSDKHKQAHVTKKEASHEDKPQSKEASADSSDVSPATKSKKSDTVKGYGDYQQVIPQQGPTVNLDPTSQLTMSSEAVAGLGVAGVATEADEENIGRGFFEGDMILTPEQQKTLDQLKDGILSSKRALIKNTTYLWPKAVVHYNFANDIDRLGKTTVKEAMEHWEERTCLKFKERNKEKNFIKFVFEGGCASRVGRGGEGMQKLSIGSPKLQCKKGNLIHEIGHSIGFFHEQSRPDRDEYVTVMSKNIISGYDRNFLKFSTKWIDSRNIPYDYGSIMHYARAFFSRMPTLLPTLVTHKDHVHIGQRVALSKSDVLQANILYNCDGKVNLNDQNEMLESNDEFYESAPCMDTYDMSSCLQIKNMGLCAKYPRTIKAMCGITCNLCSVNASKKSNAATKKTKIAKSSKSKLHKAR